MTLSLVQPPPGVPSGMIALWGYVFNVATYPQLSGWVLCDGTNGTHDMRNRLARGVPIAGTVGAVGGATNHCHAVNLPTTANGTHAHAGSTTDEHKHTHPGSGSDTYQHTHAGSSVADCAWVHSHCMSPCQYPLQCRIFCNTDSQIAMADPDHYHQIANTEAEDTHSHGLTIAQDSHSHTLTLTEDAHTHAVTVAAAPNHTHTAAGNTAEKTDLWPPYRDLHFIMKL